MEERVIVNVKIGDDFQLFVSKDTLIENINFDFTDSIIPFQDDPTNWLSSRKKWCKVDYSNGTKIVKVDPNQSEEWQMRKIPKFSCYYVSPNF